MTHWNFKQSTSVMIFVRDWVMFSIWSSRNIGSIFPFHSKANTPGVAKNHRRQTRSILVTEKRNMILVLQIGKLY